MALRFDCVMAAQDLTAVVQVRPHAFPPVTSVTGVSALARKDSKIPYVTESSWDVLAISGQA